MARIRYTAHSRRMLMGLGLTEADVQHVIGNYEETTSDEETELQSAVATLRGRHLQVVYRADSEGLVVVSVQVEVNDEIND